MKPGMSWKFYAETRWLRDIFVKVANFSFPVSAA